MKREKSHLFIGIIAIIFIVISYFIKIDADQGANYLTKDTLLGIIIFHNPFVLGLYLLIAIILIFKGIRKYLNIL